MLLITEAQITLNEKTDRWLNVSCYELGSVGSMFDECCDDELMAIAGSDVKGSVSALVLAVDLSSYTHVNKKVTFIYSYENKHKRLQ